MKWVEMELAFRLWRKLAMVSATCETDWSFHPGEPDDERDYPYMEHKASGTVVGVRCDLADGIDKWGCTAGRREALAKGGPALEILLRRQMGGKR